MIQGVTRARDISVNPLVTNQSTNLLLFLHLPTVCGRETSYPTFTENTLWTTVTLGDLEFEAYLCQSALLGCVPRSGAIPLPVGTHCLFLSFPPLYLSLLFVFLSSSVFLLFSLSFSVYLSFTLVSLSLVTLYFYLCLSLFLSPLPSQESPDTSLAHAIISCLFCKWIQTPVCWHIYTAKDSTKTGGKHSLDVSSSSSPVVATVAVNPKDAVMEHSMQVSWACYLSRLTRGERGNCKFSIFW